MQLQIKQIVLWPRKPELPPRVVTFQCGIVNVISGVSKTGKSAVIPIVDYCLGSEKCSIPVKTIRNACSWFGVVLQTAQGELLLARREPGNQKATGEMYVAQAAQVRVPERIDQPNATVDGIKATLNDLAGLTRLDFDPQQSGLGYRGRPSFRDMTAFVFQPQNIVANPNVLFYKADTTEHREKLRTIFPYVVGAVTAEVLALEHELHRLRLELKRKERELETIRQLSLRWVAEIRAKAARAHELGLLRSTPSPSASVDDLIASLRLAAAPIGTAGGREPDLSSASLQAAAHELTALEREEAEVSSALNRLKQRFADMTRFREATSEYRGSLAVRRDRLGISDWIAGLYDAKRECPLCGTAHAPSANAVTALRAALRKVEGQASSIAEVPAAFDREYQRVRADLDLETERLNAVRVRRRTLQASSEEARRRQYELSEAARFAGALEESLERYDQLSADGELALEVAELQGRVRAIEDRLRSVDVRAAIDRATQRLGNLIGRILPRLDTERPDDPVTLVIEDLMIKVAGDGRDDYLWEIGSGANWLSYHVATSIALHQLFRSMPNNHVPTFVIYDQPSQVYFPRLVEADSGTQEAAKGPVQDGETPLRFRDEDVISVRKVYQVLADAAREARGEWQAIVLDHAGSDVWGDVEGVHLVEDWHTGATLVPKEWLD